MSERASPGGSPPSAVVFGYHNVGVRCLAVLQAHGVRVPVVVTHEDAPGEAIWFDSVARTAALHDIPVITPPDPNAPDVVERMRAIAPDFLFSFYYRAMLKPGLLKLARRGAFNMHGSLLPKFRGRAPVNWAVLHGEGETGATLHEMVEKPDAGRLVDQQAVPILPNDTAREVFDKVTVAAEMVLDRSLPRLVAGTAKLTQQDLAAGSYFGGRRPEDGRIDWTRGAREVHNLVRAVAPPYPGAFCFVGGAELRLLRTLDLDERDESSRDPALHVRDGHLYVRCADGGLLRVLSAEFGGAVLTRDSFWTRFGAESVVLHN
ncbi:MAG: formyltransferase [Betaproteobacteria bacterium]|nr:formyltransferase [Betaproteobacteria bacterium]